MNNIDDADDDYTDDEELADFLRDLKSESAALSRLIAKTADAAEQFSISCDPHRPLSYEDAEATCPAGR